MPEETNPAPEEAAPTADDRIKAFLAEYGELVGKHKVDFISYPMWQPDGTPGGWKMTVQCKPVDTSNMPVNSPFISS